MNNGAFLKMCTVSKLPVAREHHGHAVVAVRVCLDRRMCRYEQLSRDIVFPLVRSVLDNPHSPISLYVLVVDQASLDDGIVAEPAERAKHAMQKLET